MTQVKYTEDADYELQIKSLPVICPQRHNA